MAEITSNAYVDLRDYIEANWTYIELRNDVGAAVVRLPVSDARVSWSARLDAGQTVELVVTVTGADADIAPLIPVSIASSALYKVASAGNAMTVESFAAFSIATADDSLTVKHRVQVPQL